MRIRSVGRCGLKVSDIGLGTMTWGRDTDKDDAAEQLTVFLDAGGTFIDTAASYSAGAAEEVLGSLLTSVARRDDLVICTKAGTRRTPNGPIIDASRGALLRTLDQSLARLGMDYVDLFLVQAPDSTTPLAETVGALEWAVSTGRARYVGLSNYPAWLAAHGATLLANGCGLAAVQAEYSLVERSPEADLVPAAEYLGFGLLAWSALGRGVLTGKYRFGTPADSRGASPHLASFVDRHLDADARAIVDAVATAATGLGCAPVDVALAWIRSRPAVSSAIIGARTAAQLRGTLASHDMVLPEEIAHALADVSASRG